ncbi:MAG: Uma2 family endonuclease [Planctomycetota bacterium]
MSTVPIRRISPEEYLALERRAERKSEFYNGEIFAMAGASREHNLIVTNLAGELSQQLKDKPCEVYPSEMRTRIPNGPYVYPDVVIVCSEPQFEDKRLDTLTNPLVVIEVLSDSTADFDRGTKFRYYRRIASLREYIVVDQAEPFVERHSRGAGDVWQLEESVGLSATLKLESPGCALSLSDIYLKVAFPPPKPVPETV